MLKQIVLNFIKYSNSFSYWDRNIVYMLVPCEMFVYMVILKKKLTLSFWIKGILSIFIFYIILYLYVLYDSA